jgi:hypothetical protein
MAKKAPPRTATTTKPLNRSLHTAKTSKQDEFYPRLSDMDSAGNGIFLEYNRHQ